MTCGEGWLRCHLCGRARRPPDKCPNPKCGKPLLRAQGTGTQRLEDEVRRLLTTLTPIESRIIRWRFGLDDEDELTLKEIGDKYNLSRERIRQLQEQALGKIRKHMRE